MKMCCHPTPPRERRGWPGNCRHWQMSLEEKGQTEFGIRLCFCMTFVDKHELLLSHLDPCSRWAPGWLWARRRERVLVSGKGCVDVTRADHGQRAALVLRQKFPLSSNLSCDDRFDWIHYSKKNHWSTLHHVWKAEGTNSVFLCPLMVKNQK